MNSSRFLIMLAGSVIAVSAFVAFRYYPDLMTVVGLMVMLSLFFFIFRANASAFSFSKNEEASGIYEIRMDKNERDFHVFTYHNSTRVKSGLSPFRIVQHYFFKAGDGEPFYSELFSHDLRAKKGGAGYDDFSTFEQSVLPSEELKESLDKFSKAIGNTLGIGRKLQCGATETIYPVEEGRAIRIDKNEQGILTRFSVLFVNSNTNDVLWRKKI